MPGIRTLVQNTCKPRVDEAHCSPSKTKLRNHGKKANLAVLDHSNDVFMFTVILGLYIRPLNLKKRAIVK